MGWGWGGPGRLETGVWLSLDSPRRRVGGAESAAARASVCCVVCREGGVRAREGPCLCVYLDASARLGLSPLERGSSGKLVEASAPFAAPE